MITETQNLTDQERISFVGHEAINLGVFDLPAKEMMCYLYLPIKLIDSWILELPRRLEVFRPLVNKAIEDFEKSNPAYTLHERYIYITAKRLFVTPDNVGNRPGWHCDGFGTDDINYIWADTHPTIFNCSRFFVRKNDVLALDDLEAQAMPSNNYELPVKSLIRIDSLTPHRTPHIDKPGMRTFVKISISKHRYNLEGNSHNYRFDYDWTLANRREVRNMENSDFVV